MKLLTKGTGKAEYKSFTEYLKTKGLGDYWYCIFF
jgi:hypothetical protein